MARTNRDLDATARLLEAWFGSRLEVESVEIAKLSVPKAGFSNETLLGHASWSDAGRNRELRFVVRVEPTDHQLFLEPNALFQARMMTSLSAYEGVPVPRVVFEEPDPGVLGAPFFVMEHVDGRIPRDVPGWHARGWTTDLAAVERKSLYENGLGALAALHAIEWRDDFAFLAAQGSRSALEAYVEHVRHWYDWSEKSRRWGTGVIDAALDYVETRRPNDASCVVTWGDARVGNMIFADDLSVSAVLDWEGAALGPPGIDVGWWLMFEEFFTGAAGIERLEGVGGRDETVALYEKLSGRLLENVEYYEILAGLVFALINSRLADLAIAGGADSDAATFYLDRTTRMLDGRLRAWS